MRGREERKKKTGNGRKRMDRILAAMLALAMVLCGMPLYGSSRQETVLAASTDGAGELYDAETGLYYEDIDGYYGSREYGSAEDMVYSLVSEFSDILVAQLGQDPDERTDQTQYYMNVTIPMDEENPENVYNYFTYAIKLATRLCASSMVTDGIFDYLSEEEVAYYRTLDIPNLTVAESFGGINLKVMLNNGLTGVYEDGDFSFGVYCYATLGEYADEMYASANNIIDSLDIAEETDDYKIAYAVAEWMDENVVYAIGDNFQYASGNAKNFLEDYANGEQLGEQNCVYYAEVYQLLLGVAGISAKGISYDTTVNGQLYQHEFNLLCINGTWIVADTYAGIGALTLAEPDLALSARAQDGWIKMDTVSRAVAKHGISMQCASYYSGCGEENHSLKLHSSYGTYYEGTGCEIELHDYYCTECGAYYLDYCKTPHTFETTEYVAPTCESDGYITYTCSSCGLYYTDELPSTGHDWEGSITEATCEESGSVTYYCKNCGMEGATYEIYPLDHDWVETVSDDGLFTTLSCTRCGESYTYSTSGEEIDISMATVTLSETAFTYNGEYQCPAVTSVAIGSRVLEEGVDYKVNTGGIKIGQSYLTVTGINNYTGTVKAYYSVVQGEQEITASLSSDSVKVGGTAQVSASITAAVASKTGALSYSSSNTSVATVDEDGLVEGISSGTATITVSAAETTYYNAASVTLTVTVYVGTDISDANTYTITVKDGTYTYDGMEKEPSVTVESAYATLAEGRDYYVSYSDNVNAGTATVTVKGAGSYTGTVSKTFVIDKAPQEVAITGTTSYKLGEALALTATTTGGGAISWSYPSGLLAAANGTAGYAGTYTVTATAAETDNYYAGSASITVTYAEKEKTDISGADITLGTSAYTYDGTTKEPGVTVKVSGATLTKGTDYTVSYSNNVNAGTATVTITGCGDYTGTATKAFTISKAAQAVSVTSGTSLSLTAGGTSQIRATASGGGALSYASSGTSTATVGSTGLITAKAAGTATITVTAAATANYNAGTATISVTVSRAAQGMSVSPTSATLSVGGTKQLAVTGAKTTLSYSSSDTSVATVSASGLVTAKGVGTATITLTAAQTGAYAKETKTVTISVKPAAPTISKVSNTASGVKVSWGKVSGATGYYIYRSTSKNGTYTKVGTVTSGSTASWTNKATGTNKVASGKTYYYKVYAYASTGTSSASGIKSIRFLSAGKASSATNTSSGITVKWSKVTGASGYYIYRKAGSGSYKKIATVSGGSTVSYTNKTSGTYKVSNGTTYSYYVKPYYTSGSTTTTGSYSGTVTMVRLTAVTLSSVTNSSSKAITVKISKKNAKATGYQIQYSTSSNFSSGNKTATITGASTLSKKISSLTKGKTYYVRVRAYKTVSGTKYYSAWSAKKSVKVSK